MNFFVVKLFLNIGDGVFDRWRNHLIVQGGHFFLDLFLGFPGLFKDILQFIDQFRLLSFKLFKFLFRELTLLHHGL